MAHLDSPPKSGPAAPLLAVQVGVFAAMVGTIALAPPADGPMLLVPLRSGPVAALNLAIAQGASLLSPGPLPGTLVVYGERARLVPTMLAGGTLVVAAAPLICGEPAAPAPISAPAPLPTRGIA